ncbi:MAG: hypothetical protein V1676_03735 [Candidatus Diapherotrites archaeon]
MPVKPLPPELVNRLRKAAKKLDSLHLKMKNMDHRGKHGYGRVREIRLNKNKGAEVVIKRTHGLDRTHGMSADEVISCIENKVDEHNKGLENFSNRPKRDVGVWKKMWQKVWRSKQQTIEVGPNYILRKPFAHAIGKDLIAMERTGCPSLREVLGDRLPYGGTREKTIRGATFFEEIKKKHKVTDEELINATLEVCGRTDIDPDNMLLLGYEKGKFIFMPLLDYW